MKNKQQFSTAISNEEHFVRVKETYNKEVFPFLEENRKAYKLYLQGKWECNLNSVCFFKQKNLY